MAIFLASVKTIFDPLVQGNLSTASVVFNQLSASLFKKYWRNFYFNKAANFLLD
jgi:hypothetical protein